jgi:outer membrane protein OmpA-like peptidoglycan-associated protein
MGKNLTILLLAAVIWTGLNEETALSANAATKKREDKSHITGILLQKANAAYNTLNYYLAANYYANYLSGNNNPDKMIKKRLADCYWQTRDYKRALALYLDVYHEHESEASNSERFRIAEMLARRKDYLAAAEWLPEKGFDAKRAFYQDPLKIASMMKDSLLWNIHPLSINSPYRDFSPSIIDSTLFFCSNRPESKKTSANGWDGAHYIRVWKIMLSNLQQSSSLPSLPDTTVIQLMPVKPAKIAAFYEGSDNKDKRHKTISTDDYIYIQGNQRDTVQIVDGLLSQYNVANLSHDKDGDVFFTANDKPDYSSGIARITVMSGKMQNGRITSVKPLLFKDPSLYNIMHVAIDSSGRVMVFSCAKAGKASGYDLYYAQRKSRDRDWEYFQIFNDSINTDGNEVFPAITDDGFLYFSSDGKPGFGGLDIYRIPLQDAIAGKGNPVHLPYPINSPADDFGWTQTKNGETGYFTSDRQVNEDNIFSVSKVVKKPKPVPKLPEKMDLDGYVLDRETKEPIGNATVFMLVQNDKRIFVANTNADGYYHFTVKPDWQIVIKAMHKGFTNDCLAMQAKLPDKGIRQHAARKLLLGRFVAGFVWRLNILYDFNKWDIRPDARPILDSVVSILKKYPINVELGSHTDCRGPADYNQKLSQKRAEAAVAYIVSQGIAAQRITAKGYGESKLLNKCSDGVPCSDEEHQLNRRTEIKVVKSGSKDVDDHFDPSAYTDDMNLVEKDLPAGFFGSCK